MISLMGTTFSLKLDKIGKSELRLMISLRKYIASQHKPNVTKCLTEYFGSEKMLDFSIAPGRPFIEFGWRKSSTINHYVGIDPRKENHPIYKKQGQEFYQNTLHFLRIQQK